MKYFFFHHLPEEARFPFHPYAYTLTSGNIHLLSVGSLLNSFKPVGNLNHTRKIVRD